MLKGVIAKCDGCNKSFTSKELVWNTIVNWVRKLNQQQVPIFLNMKKRLYAIKIPNGKFTLEISL
jgi:hypothetical protein